MSAWTNIFNASAGSSRIARGTHAGRADGIGRGNGGGAHAALPALRLRKSRIPRWAAAAAGAVVLLAAALVLAAWLGALRLPGAVQDGIDLWPDPHAKTGTLAASSVEVEAGSFQLVLNQAMTVAAGARELPLAFENPAANAYGARVEVVMDGQVVARSGMVAPGSRLDALACDRALGAGEHRAVAWVLLYADGTLASELSADVTVYAE